MSSFNTADTSHDRVRVSFDRNIIVGASNFFTNNKYRGVSFDLESHAYAGAALQNQDEVRTRIFGFNIVFFFSSVPIAHCSSVVEYKS